MRSWKNLLLLALAIGVSIAGAGCGGSASQPAPPPVTKLSISGAASLPGGNVGTAYSAALGASGGTAPYNWSVASGSLPAGLTLSSAGIISGTPTTNGSSSFTVQAADTETTPQTAVAQMSITILATLGGLTTSLPNGIASQAYAASLAAAGGLPPYSWTIVSGVLPAGLSLRAGGIKGTPTAAGSASFTVQVADSQTKPQTATQQLSVTIVNQLSATTTSLPNGVTGQPYSQSLAASGGLSPYSWTITAGELPAGLSLDAAGAITGTPTSVGLSSFTVQVADAELPAVVASAQLSISIVVPAPVLTQQYDNSRTGQDLNEVLLTPSNVASGNFGKLFSVAVDGKVYAQPLYVSNVAIPGKGIHNVFYVVSEHDSVYALDADSNTGGNSSPLWQDSFIDPSNGITTVPSTDVNCNNLVPEIGITSTPVIDPDTNTLYVVAETKESGQYFQRLHALDIASGAEKFGGPIVIQATYPGTGDGSSGGMIPFDPLLHLNRPALLLANGTVYIGWGTNCDERPAHGWIMAFDKATLQQQASWVTTPNGQIGGVWMSGAGLSADAAGNIFFSTGNGTFDTSGTPVDFGDSIVKLTQNGNQFVVSDYFTPYDEGNLEDGDVDVGSGGVLLLPDQPGAHLHEAIEEGKGKSIYVVDRDQMGHYNPDNNSQIVQNLVDVTSGMFAVPAYWGGNVYFGSGGYPLQAFSLTSGLLSSAPTSQSSDNPGYPGATPVVSSNGANNGILWALQTSSRLNGGDEVLHAYDATDLTHELYNSTQNESRDDPGPLVKFAVPTVANGKVYVGSATQVSVYGLLTQH
ncbi:MAG: Ig domain-containing protein [Candidatus Korobacteraceae bacterium]